MKQAFKFKYLYILIALGILQFSFQSRRPNVLIIIIDDLKAELKCYGANRAISPNIDAFAEESMIFLHAYCQKTVCVPSRQSFLTGTRPNTFGAGFGTHFREKLPNCVTLPQQFKMFGYQAESVGKVFHHRDDVSWSRPSWVPEPDLCYPIYKTPKNIAIQKNRIKQGDYFSKDSTWWAKGNKWVPASIWEAPDVEDNELLDGMVADHAISRLKALKDTAFFMTVGFFRPHIPFIAPKKYYDQYPLNSISLPEDHQLPIGSPPVAGSSKGEWRRYSQVVQVGMPDTKTQKEYIRGYLASISYVDAQVGRLLQSLEELGLEENTMVVLMSDHGYHLFDKASFGKQTNFENTTRVPLIVKQAGNHKPQGVKTSALVELLDIYPTLCDLAKIPTPIHVQGKSFIQTLNAPSFPGKEAAYSQYKRNGFQGSSVRTESYRFTQWKKDNIIYQELYDYEIDPNETINLVHDDRYQETIPSLTQLLNQIFKP